MKNSYWIIDDCVYIKIIRNSGEIFWTVIDLDDLELIDSYNKYWTVYKGKKDPTYYVCVNVNGSKIQMHRIICKLNNIMLVPDHISKNGLDNRKENLQVVTQSQNIHLGFERILDTRGIYWRENERMWIVSLQVNNKRHTLRRKTRKAAIKAMQELRNTYLEVQNLC